MGVFLLLSPFSAPSYLPLTLPQHICQTIFTPQRTFFQRHLWLSFPMSLVPPHGWLQRLFSVRCTSGCEEVTRFMQSGKGTIATPLLAGPRWNKKTQTYYQCPFKRFLLQATYKNQESMDHMMDATETKTSKHIPCILDTRRAG